MKTTSTFLPMIARSLNSTLVILKSKFSIYILTLVVIAGLGNSLYAAHITGSYFTYAYLGPNQYEITYNRIIVCSSLTGIPGSYLPPTGSGTPQITNSCSLPNPTFTFVFDSWETLTQACDGNSSCDGGPIPGYRLERFKDTLTFSGSCDSWVFSKQSCCTAGSIVNQTPNSPFYFETIMNSGTDSINQSPYPLRPGAPNYYAFEQVLHNFDFVDPDGDSLNFSLVSSRNSVSTPRVYTGPYSGLVPMDNIEINASNGQLIFSEDALGEYIVTIKVDEYRDGSLIGTVYFETSFTISFGTIGNLPPENLGISNVIGASQVGSSQLTTCQSSNVNFDISFDDFNLSDTLSIDTSTFINSVIPYFPLATYTVIGVNPLTVTVNLDASSVSPGYYNLAIECKDDGCNFYKSTTAVIGFTVFPDVEFDVSSENITCFGQENGSLLIDVESAPVVAASCAGSPGPTSTFFSNVLEVEILGETIPLSYTPDCPGVVGIDDKTALSTDLIIGNTYSLDVKFGSCNGLYNAVGEAWIDWNSNGTFELSESIGDYGPQIPNLSNTTFNFTVPPGAVESSVRLRVSMIEDYTLTGLSPPLDPCASFLWGSIMDFTLNITGSVSNYTFSANGVSSSASGNLKFYENLAPGLQILTVSDLNGCSATDTVTISQPDELIASLTAKTDATCFGGSDGLFNFQAVGGNAYCQGGPSISFDSNVESVQLTGNSSSINYSHSCPGEIGIVDQTASTADLSVGGTYNLGVQFGTCGGNYSGAGEAWIDYNGDGDFDLTESLGTWVGTPPTALSSFIFTVPISACNGAVRLRVMQQEQWFGGLTPPLNPCGSFVWGSVMDFTVQLTGASCNAEPPGYTFSIDNGINEQDSTTFTNLTSGIYVVEIQDQLGCDAQLPVVINQPTQHLAQIQSVTDISCFGELDGEAVALGVKLPPTYCKPVYGRSASAYLFDFFIDDFSIDNGSTIFANLGSGLPVTDSTYSNFTTSAGDTISLNPGSTYNFNVTEGGGTYPISLAIFIDYNQDGEFDDVDEFISLGSAVGGGTASISATIPANVAGYTRLRIISVYNSTPHAPITEQDYCKFFSGGLGFGEFEDYTIFLGDPFQYQINGGGYQVSNNFSGLTSGPFTIDVRDNYGCLESISGNINEPLELLSTISSIDHESCETFNDGRILGGAMGGTAISGSNPYLYQVVGPTPLGPQTSNVFEDLSPGTYDLIVTDANSCTDTSAFPIFIGNTAPAPLSTNLDPAYYGDHPDIGLYATSSPIPTTTIGYTFAGDGIWSDSLHPSALADGTYEAIYNYYDGTCLFSDTASFSILAPIKNILIPGKVTPTAANPWVFCSGDAGSYAIKGLPLSKYGANFLDTSYVLSTRIAPPASVSGPFVDTSSAVLVNLDTLAAGSYPIRFYSYVPVYSVDSIIGTSTFVGWDSVLTEQNFIIRQINPGTILGLEEDYCEGDPSSILSVTNQSVFPPVPTGFAWGNTNGGFTGPSVGVDPTFYPDSIGSGDTTVVTYYVTDNQLYCSASTSFSVNYHPKPAISFTGINDTVCSYFSDTVLSSPSIGVFSNGIGLVSNVGVNDGSAVFDVNAGSNSAHWTTNLDYSWEYFPSCTVDSLMTITVMPDAATSFTVVDFMGDTVGLIDPLEICHNDSVTYFANSLGVPVSNGFFPWDLTTIGQAPLIGSNTSSVAEITEYPFEYTYDDGINQCPYYDTLDIEVYPLPTVAIIGLNAEYCSDEDSSALTLLPNSNGILTFYNGGIIDTISASPPYLNPAIFTVDTNFFVNYHYTDSLSGCVNDYLSAVNVNAGPIPLTSNIEPSYFSNHPDVGIYPIASPIPDFSVDYSFAGDGVWLDTLHPAALTPGIYDVIYNYIDGFCQFSDTSSFTINPAIENIIIPSKTVPADPWIFCKGDLNMYEIKGIPLSRYGGNFVNSSYLTAAYIPPALNLTGPFEDTLIATLSNIDGLAAGQYPIEFYSYIPVYSVDTAVGNSSFVEWDSVLVIKNFTIRQLVPGSILGLEVDYCEGDLAGLLSVSGQGAFPPVSTVSEWTHTNGGFSPSPSASDPIFAPTSIGSGDSTQVIYTISDDEGYCSASTQQMVYYHPEPVISFSGITDTVCSYFSDTVFCSPSIGVFSNGIGLVSNVGFNVGSAVFEVTSGASSTHWTTNLDYSYEYFSGCTVDSSMLITVMPDATPSFTVVDFIGDTVTSISPLEMCHNDSVTYFASSLGAAVINGYFPWDLSTVGQAPLIGANTSSVAEITGYPFEYVFDDGFNQCPYYDTLDVEVFPLPTIAILGLNTKYCSDDDSVNLTLLPNNNGILTLSHDGLIDTLSSSAPLLDPAIFTSDTAFFMNYHYTDSLSGCSNDYLAPINIFEAPTADYYIIDSCAMNPTTFISTSLGNATSFIWDLDDGGLASGDTVIYTYAEPGIQVIELTASSNNCSNTFVDSVNIGNTPLPDFTYAYGCYDQYGIHTNAPALFYDASSTNSGPAIGEWFWDFGDAGTLADTSILDTTSYSYQAATAYDVSLYVENIYGCGDTITKQLVVQPYYNLMDTITMPSGYQRSYFENLESATPDWLIDNLAGTNSSWELGSPTGVINSAFSGSNAYVTSLSGSYNDNELSFVYGPCFDLSRLKRPMIKLRTWSDVIDFGTLFGSNDGARLEYWAGTSTGWMTLGNTTDGINWYNGDSIYSGSVSTINDLVGWSGQDGDWKDSRYKLDEIRDGLDNDTLVRFRIAFHSDTLLAGGGFAFDNVWIGERKKRVLVEHFTNTEDPLSNTHQPDFDQLMDDNVLDAMDLQYHTEIPDGDLLWSDYPSGPNARTLYYSTSGVVPYSINDGILYRDSTQNWIADSAVFKANSLRDPGFIIDLTGTNIDAVSRVIDVRVKLEALNDYINENIRVHIAVIEDNAGVSGAQNVVRRMLPDAGGSILPVLSMFAYDTLSMDPQTWTVPASMDISNIMVVAFVQNYNTQEVYQCADNINYLIATDDAVEDANATTFRIFPNPAKYEATIAFNAPISESYWLEVFNGIGQKVDQIRMAKGASRARVSLQKYTAGMYIVRITANESVIGWSRLIKQ